MNQETKGRGTLVSSCFNWCIFLLKMSFSLRDCVFSSPADVLQPLGGAQVFPYQGLLYPPWEDREGLQNRARGTVRCEGLGFWRLV